MKKRELRRIIVNKEKNKKAVIDSFLGLFVATIILVLLLVGFALLSGAVKTFANKGSWGIEKWQMSKYTSSLMNLAYLRLLVNSDLENPGYNNFYQLMQNWEKDNTDEIKTEIAKINEEEVSLEIQKSGTEEKIFCLGKKCQVGSDFVPQSPDFEELYNPSYSILEFQVSPLNVKIKIQR